MLYWFYMNDNEKKYHLQLVAERGVCYVSTNFFYNCDTMDRRTDEWAGDSLIGWQTDGCVGKHMDKQMRVRTYVAPVYPRT